MNNDHPTARLKTLRERAGLSIREMAQAVGMKPSGYNHYELPDRFKGDFLPMSLAITIARALEPRGIDPDEVMRLAGSGLHPSPQAVAQTEPHVAEPATLSTDGEAAKAILRNLFPDATTPATYRLQIGLPGFAYRAGDVVVADLARLPTDGELCLVTLFDDDMATSATTVARYLPPFLVSGNPDSTQPMMRVDTDGVTVRYPVIGSLRGVKAA